MPTITAIAAATVAEPAHATAEFSQVYDAHAPYVWRVLRHLGVPNADVEDVCQEVFMVVHRKLGAFEFRSTLKTWLYGIAFRCASRYRRRGSNRALVADADAPLSAGPTQFRNVEQQQALAQLDAILSTLTGSQRAVFALYEIHEMTMEEITEIMNCPVQTAYSRLHAARRKVRQAFAAAESAGKRA